MKSIKHLILITALLSIAGSVSQIYAMKRVGLDEPEPEEERKELMEVWEIRATQEANEDLLKAVATQVDDKNVDAVKAVVRTVRDALNRGANPNARDSEGNTALHLVKNAAVAQLLIAAGGDVNARNEDGSTPLHTAHNGKVAAALLNAGAQLDALDGDGQTPLRFACGMLLGAQNRNMLDVMDTLLAWRANQNITNDKGQTPLQELVMAFDSRYATTQDPESRSSMRIYNNFFNNLIKPAISKLIRAGAKLFNTNLIKDADLQAFVRQEFVGQGVEEAWVGDWPSGTGPAIVEHVLQEEHWPRGVPGVVSQYLGSPAPALPADEEGENIAAAGDAEKEKKE